jgi:hypothetical protein
MWLTIAGITLLAAIGFSVLAFALQWFQKARRGAAFYKRRVAATRGRSLLSMKIALENWRGSSISVRSSRVTPLSLRSAPSAGNPLANTISDCEANDQSNYNFHWRRLPCPQQPNVPAQLRLLTH